MKKITILFCALALLTSCGTTKRTPKHDKDGLETMLKQEAEKKQYEAMLAKSFDFKTLSAKAKYSFNGASLSGKFFVEHGKRLAMTMTVLGIEVVRIEADTKNVTLVDKFDRMYSVIPIEEFAEKFGMRDEMRFEALEALLLGRVFIPGVGEASAKDSKHFILSLDAAGSLIAKIKKNKYQLNYYSTPAEDIRLETTEVIVGNDAQKNVSVKYSNYLEIGGGELPTLSDLSLGLFNEKINATLSLTNPTLDGKPIAAFKPTSAYKEVGVKELFEAIKNLKK